MKKLVVLILSIIFVLSLFAFNGCSLNGGDKNFISKALDGTPYLRYKKIEDKEEYRVTGIDIPQNYANEKMYIEIPLAYNGLPVTTISPFAFSEGCSNILSVVIGDNVTTIYPFAFDGCSNLLSVVIGKSVTSIWLRAFDGCYRLAEFINKSSLIIEKGTYTSATGEPSKLTYALGVYNKGDKFKSKLSNDNDYIIYNDGNNKILIGYIGDKTELVLPKYITEINAKAFLGCKNLTSIEIPKSVKKIGFACFSECFNLAEVNYLGTIDGWAEIEFCDNMLNYDSNPIWYAKKLKINGKEITEINLKSASKISAGAFYGMENLLSVTIPNNVTTIGDHAFWGCNSLASVVIPNNVTIIKSGTFGNCSSLSSVVIPNSVTIIHNRAFWNCSSLQYIYYGGTQEEWFDIIKGESWGNNTGSCTIIYNYTGK